ncbi:MAG TPA: SpoIIE family protein phosphatase [Acidimicrobiales bacterium]|nr:SpoIIE family protein phosphatase [Acidimicrobiales bacterium]
MSGCRALVAGFGRPGMRDLDFGRQLVDCLQQLDWPDGVVVEDLSCSVPLVLHRLQELRPAKVVLLGAVPRELDPPATIRRYHPDQPTDVADIDHTLAAAHQWGGLPSDTVVIEVEPAETSFGMGFSEELAGCIDRILDMVREEVGDAGDLRLDLEVAEPPTVAPEPAEPSESISDLLVYARDHADARQQSHRAPALAVAGLDLAGRVRPWGVFVESGGDWYDAVPLENGPVGIVVGNMPGRGVEQAPAMADLRAAVRAYAVLEGEAPAALVTRLDRLAATTGLGRDASLLYLVIDPPTGDVRYVNAGGCPPLLLGQGFVDGARSGPVGPGADRTEGTFRLDPESTLLLFTDGLVQSPVTSRGAGLERLRRAAARPPKSLDELCDRVLTACTADGRRDDDICLLALRRQPAAVPARQP